MRPVPFSLALLDLDGFKAINDREGHSQGDKVLRVFAETLNVELPGGASLYRVGGDEFVVLLNSDDVPLFDEQLDIALLAARQVVAGSVGVSLGMAHSHEAAGPVLVQLADARMYALKERRRAQRDTQHQDATKTL
ncbi:GGDEF domain-containing protein [Deinococcus sp. PESE-13]